MFCVDRQYYAFKYVNGYPGNPLKGKLNVVAIGLLSDADSGYPLIMTEMTLLTAFRTAATGVLAAKYLARKDSKYRHRSAGGISGTGIRRFFSTGRSPLF